MNTVDSRRTSNGLAVAIMTTPAGETRANGCSNHTLGVHLGRIVRATCRFGGRTQRRIQSRGDMDLLPAGLPGTWEDDRSTRVMKISVSASLLQEAAEGLGVHTDRVELVPQHQLRDPQLEHIAWALEAELRSPDTGEWLYGEGLAMALAARLLGRYRSEGGAVLEPSHGLPRRKLDRVTDYVEAHLQQRLSLTELAEVAGASVSHFKTLFKRSTRVPVHQYVMQRRIERARSLLEQGTPITVVALDTGFTDPSHMARWMRRLRGLTPSQVQKLNR
jgi:AraC family transcriptional regulator